MFSSLFPSGVAVSECAIEGAQGDLFPEESVVVSGAVEKRRREFIAGRTCARRALAAVGGPEVGIPVGAHREPLWPAGYVGSITHAGGMASAAVGFDGDFVSIGIDMEERGRVTPDVHSVLLTAREREWLAGQGGVNGDPWPTVLFCAKEAFYKFQYPLTGWFVDFKEVGVSVDVESNAFRVEWVTGRLKERKDILECEGRFAIGSETVYAAVWKRSRV